MSKNHRLVEKELESREPYQSPKQQEIKQRFSTYPTVNYIYKEE